MQAIRTIIDLRNSHEVPNKAWYSNYMISEAHGWQKMMYIENHTKKPMKFLREARMIATTKELGGG